MTREKVLHILREQHDALARRGVKSLALFGSSARDGAGTESDVDLLVEFDHPIGLFTFLEVKELLEEVLGVPVDLGTPESLHPRLRARVLQEAVCVA